MNKPIQPKSFISPSTEEKKLSQTQKSIRSKWHVPYKSAAPLEME